ncbi:50S ribosomal protein L15 [Chlamydiales bacterium SCGC AG-110-M15]|nr:50S ribosomal protein L15 [Chlamydiales bacterium SCGC AG-110-M15]
MSSLNTLKNTHRKPKSRMRVGRGPGSGKGKTSGRGIKGAGARSGYKRRYGKEGGQFPLYLKLPTRGFSNVAFQKRFDSVNLRQIDAMFEDGETVNLQTLKDKGFISGPSHGLKILGDGELTKNVAIEAHAFSKSAMAALEEKKIKFTLITNEKK